MPPGAWAEKFRLDPSPDDAPLPGRTRALVTYALKLTRAPARVTAADLAPLRAAGLSDRGIHDAAAVAAYYNFVNRLAEGLGVALESGPAAAGDGGGHAASGPSSPRRRHR